MKTETAPPAAAAKSIATITLRMSDGTLHFRPASATWQLYRRAQRALKGRTWPIPENVWATIPDLVLFRDAVSISASDGSRVHELLVLFLKGPNTAPRESCYSDAEREEMRRSDG